MLDRAPRRADRDAHQVEAEHRHLRQPVEIARIDRTQPGPSPAHSTENRAIRRSGTNAFSTTMSLLPLPASPGRVPGVEDSAVGERHDQVVEFPGPDRPSRQAWPPGSPSGNNRRRWRTASGPTGNTRHSSARPKSQIRRKTSRRRSRGRRPRLPPAPRPASCRAAIRDRRATRPPTRSTDRRARAPSTSRSGSRTAARARRSRAAASPGRTRPSGTPGGSSGSSLPVRLRRPGVLPQFRQHRPRRIKDHVSGSWVWNMLFSGVPVIRHIAPSWSREAPTIHALFFCSSPRAGTPRLEDFSAPRPMVGLRSTMTRGRDGAVRSKSVARPNTCS